MSFTAFQVRFLQRLVADKPEFRQAEAARFFCTEFSLGVLLANKVVYRPSDFENARALLENNDLPVEALGPEASRADAAVFGGMSEKSFSAAPHARSVAVKALGACAIDGHVLYAPKGGYTVLSPADAQRVSCQRLMLVENLETFRHLESYGWIDWRALNVLAVYRGDPELPNKDAAHVVSSRFEPVWAFVDFDPAGLAIANGLPAQRLERLVLPSLAWLQQAANTPRGRQLFDRQRAQNEPTLDAAVHPEVIGAWQLMKRLRSGVTQERMLAADPPAVRLPA